MKKGQHVVVGEWEMQIVKMTKKGNLLLRPVRKVSSVQVVEIARDNVQKELGVAPRKG